MFSLKYVLHALPFSRHTYTRQVIMNLSTGICILCLTLSLTQIASEVNSAASCDQTQIFQQLDAQNPHWIRMKRQIARGIALFPRWYQYKQEIQQRPQKKPNNSKKPSKPYRPPDTIWFPLLHGKRTFDE